MSDLPSSWELVPLGQLCELKTGPFGSSLHKSDYTLGGIPIINPMHISDGAIYPSPNHSVTEITAARLSDFQLNPGDVVLGRRGEMGRCAVVRPHQKGWLCGTGSLILKPVDGLVPTYLQRFLTSPTTIKTLVTASVGSTMTNINQGVLLSLNIPFPSLAEQTRIVEKLEELFSDLDAGVAELKAAQKKLAQYRQSLLKAAVEGALTAEWRTRRAEQGSPVETGAQLLTRILAERRRRWEEKQLAKFTEQGKTPPKDWQTKYPEPVQPDTSDLPELPEGWTWTRVGNAGDVQLGRQRAPQYHTGANMVPYLRVANVFEDRIDVSDVMEMHFSPEEEENFKLRYDDILLNEGQSLELVGRSAIFRDELPRACFTNTLVRFRAEDGVQPEYAQTLFLHYLHSGRFRKVATITTNIAHLGAGRLAEIEFPLPGAEEQQEIVAILKEELERIQQLQEATKISLRQSEAQRKNILKAAFSGQLVAQDPNDEPASLLLERIHAAREERAQQPKPRKAKVNKQEIQSLMKKLVDVLAEAGDWITAEEAFRRCGVTDGTSTERIEELYAELRELVKAEPARVEVEREANSDNLKLIAKAA